MIWIVVLAIAVTGLGWVKVRRRRKMSEHLASR